MRPIRLRVKGFTAFRDEQMIDFADLDLFAIVGPTGSGKSSLLDAITYALYGEVDRVGKSVSQLVSQGQPRMVVTFEFGVAGTAYRVTRSTASAKTGQTRVLLEVRDGDGWQQAGDGADRVREVNARLQRAIGLDYDAFTRSVLLPQGRFAEFLVGEAKHRREILTELLGLELFKRLAKRAGEIRTAAASAAQAKADLLDTAYAGVTPKAVASARAAAKESASRAKALAVAAKQARAAAKKGARAEAEVRELRGCAKEAGALGGAADGVALTLDGLASELSTAHEGVAAAVEGTQALTEEAASAAEARERAELEWGRITDLATMRAQAEDLGRRRGELAATEKELSGQAAALPKLERAAVAAGKAHEKAGEARGRGERTLAAAREAVDRAQHANLVVAVREGASVGDPCPVCGVEIAKLPRASGSADVASAKKAVEAAGREVGTLDATARAADRSHGAAVDELTRATEELDRLQADLDRRRAELAEAQTKLSDALGGAEDPIASLDERIASLDRMASVERATSEAAAKAGILRIEAERTLTALLGRVGEQRATLAAQPVTTVVERAKQLAGAERVAAKLPSVSKLPDDPARVSAAAASVSQSMRALAGRLEDEADRREASTGELLARAEAAIEGLLEWRGGGLEDLAETIGDAAREASAVSATTIEQVARLAERLEAARALAGQVRDSRERAERFAALAKELRADNVIEFLQLEALQLLAAGASDRLATLSDGRFRLAFEGDEFFVIDVWNGEEPRSARTLSGGETFLASLALALALSEQVQALAVTEKAGLESLFLDEGFGTLDPETLEIVVGAIEQLGGDERMVGVITHVQELAIRLPARIEVEKSPRGSRLTVTG